MRHTLLDGVDLIGAVATAGVGDRGVVAAVYPMWNRGDKVKHTEETLRRRMEFLEKQVSQLRAQLAAERCRGGTQHETFPLTRRQVEVLAYLRQYVLGHRYAPTFEEIADRFGFSSLATVHEHLTHLERKGYIRRSYNEARAIEVLFQRIEAA